MLGNPISTPGAARPPLALGTPPTCDALSLGQRAEDVPWPCRIPLELHCYLTLCSLAPSPAPAQVRPAWRRWLPPPAEPTQLFPQFPQGLLPWPLLLRGPGLTCPPLGEEASTGGALSRTCRTEYAGLSWRPRSPQWPQGQASRGPALRGAPIPQLQDKVTHLMES